MVYLPAGSANLAVWCNLMCVV